MKIMQKNRAIFFDRDGVLNVDRGYVYKKEQFIWVTGAIDALKLAASRGFLSIVVTNQSGIARGYYSLDDMHCLHQWMKDDLVSLGAKIDDFYYCPYHSEGTNAKFLAPDHPDRKPNPGMLLRAAVDHSIDLGGSLLIGDKQTDLEAASRAGVKSILFNGDNLYQTLIDWFEQQGAI